MGFLELFAIYLSVVDIATSRMVTGAFNHTEQERELEIFYQPENHCVLIHIDATPRRKPIPVVIVLSRILVLRSVKNESPFAVA